MIDMPFIGISDIYKNRYITWEKESVKIEIVLDMMIFEPVGLQEITYIYEDSFNSFCSFIDKVHFNNTLVYHGDWVSKRDFGIFICDTLYLSGVSPQDLYSEMSYHELLERFLPLKEKRILISNYLI